MKRYWKLMVIAIVVVISVGTFYIKSAISASQLPEFVIKKLSGNDKEVEPILVNVDYQEGSINNSLMITSKGSESKDEQSFFERLNNSNMPFEIKKLQKDFRSFMRGKNPDESSYYEDQNRVAYGYISYKRLGVSPSDFKFQLSVLEKKDEKKTSFQLAVPNESNYENVYVQDVQMVGKQLKIITENINKIDSNNQSEVHVYTFDVIKKKIIGDDIITEIPKSDDDVYTQMVQSIPLQPNKYIVQNRQVINNVTQADGSVVGESSTSELLVYNLETKTNEIIKRLKELQEPLVVNSYDGSTIYFTEIDESGVRVASYDIESKKVENNFNIQVPQMEKDANVPLTIENGKVYILTPYVNVKKGATLIVADLKSGNILYKGKIVRKDGKEDKSDAFLNVFNIEIN